MDSLTRAVSLELTVYNVNVNLFAQVKFTLEMPASGGVFPFRRLDRISCWKLIAQKAYIYCAVVKKAQIDFNKLPFVFGFGTNPRSQSYSLLNPSPNSIPNSDQIPP